MSKVVVERTSKRLKFNLVLAWIGVIVAVFWALGVKASAGLNDETGDYSKPLILLVASIAWGVITRIRIWWNHG